MSLDSLLRHSLEVRRSVPVTPAQLDEYGNPVYAADSVIATVPGWVQPLAITEQVLTTDMGPVSVNARAYLRPTDVTEADRIRNVTLSETYEVRAVRPAAGMTHHLELDLWRVHV